MVCCHAALQTTRRWRPRPTCPSPPSAAASLRGDVVPGAGLEPARSYEQGILSPLMIWLCWIVDD